MPVRPLAPAWQCCWPNSEQGWRWRSQRAGRGAWFCRRQRAQGGGDPAKHQLEIATGKSRAPLPLLEPLAAALVLARGTSWRFAAAVGPPMSAVTLLATAHTVQPSRPERHWARRRSTLRVSAARAGGPGDFGRNAEGTWAMLNSWARGRGAAHAGISGDLRSSNPSGPSGPGASVCTVELFVVASGARRDRGQLDLLVILMPFSRQWVAKLWRRLWTLP